jgi:bifunctional non-homologous end joining protein LigD
MAGASAPTKRAIQSLLTQLDEIERGAGGGVLTFPGGQLEVTSLRKVFWPGALTKGDLFRHYVRVAPMILPVLADRPLVMKRYPNGVAGSPFYQHRAPDKVPEGVRIERVTTGTETRPHLVGGSLTTLLYTAQLGAISQDPWFSRVDSPGAIDHVAIDLDPPDGLPYARVLDVARWVRDALTTLKATGFAKTSGAGGLHVYVPMRPGTSYDSGLLFAQIVAAMVAERHPKQATIERSIKARAGRIYVDYMQNGLGKTLASAYSARASEFAGVSTPITWDEVDEGVSPRDFTVANFDQRIKDAGDVWEGLRKTKGPELRSLQRAAETQRRRAK